MTSSFATKQFTKMLFLMLMSMLVMILTDFISHVVAAQMIGSTAMAAVNLTSSLMDIVQFSALLFATGTMYLYSFEVGAFRVDIANRLAGQGIILMILLGVIFTILLFIGEDFYFSFFADAKETLYFAREYYSWYKFALILLPIYNFMQMIVYSDGGGTNCFIAVLVQFFVNIAASIFFTSSMGIAGTAVGYTIGNIASLAIFSKWVFFDSETLKPTFYFSLKDIVKTVKYSYAHASVYLYLAVGDMILNVFFLRTFGEEYLPTLSVIFVILQCAVFFDAIGTGVEPIVNIYLGEKNYDGVKKSMTMAIKTALLFGTISIPILLLFGSHIAGIFGITDEKILTETVNALRFVAFSMPFLALLYLFSTYYQICEHMKIAFFMSLCKDFIFYVTLPIILSIMIGLNGMWLGMAAVSAVTSISFAIFLRVRYPKSFPLLLPKYDIVSFDTNLTMEKVMEVRNWAENEYKKRGFNEKSQMYVALLIEEIGMTILENNPESHILAEVTLFFDDKPKIIIRDNGKHFDITEDKLRNFRDYFLLNFLTAYNIGNKFLMTQNYNRHIFQISEKKLKK